MTHDETGATSNGAKPNGATSNSATSNSATSNSATSNSATSNSAMPEGPPSEELAIRMIADVAEVAAEPVPPRVRAAVLAAVRHRTATRRPPLPAGMPPVAAPYAAQVTALDALLSGLTPGQWATTVLNDWDVADVVAHLYAVDALLAAAVGVPVVPETAGQKFSGTADSETGHLPGDPDAVEADIAARTVATQRAFADRPNGEVQLAWRGQAIALLNHASAQPGTLERTIAFAGLELPVGGVLLDRAGEAWIHAEDIRSALGLPSQPPRPDDVEALADGGVRLLPARWPAIVPAVVGQVLLSLLGDRPRDWLVDPATGSTTPLPAGTRVDADVRATVRIDELEFCYLLGGRRTPTDVGHHGTGDPRLVRATLAAAAGFARL